jgi:phosphoglycerol transferase
LKISWTRGRRDAAVAVGLAVAIALSWALEYHVLFGAQRLEDPLSYRGDALLTLASVSAARRGDYLPFFSKMLPSLGAPFVASWNDWPITEDWLLWLVGTLGRLVGSVAAINLGYALACMTAGVSMFYVARRFGLRRDTSALAGFLFGLSNYIIVRTVHHYTLTFVWAIPWNLLVASWLASRRGIPLGSRRFTLAAVTTVCTAWGFIYYSFFAAQLFAFASLAGVFRLGWSKKRVLPVAALAGIFVAALLAVNLDTVVFAVRNGVNETALQRSRTDVETYALKPINLFVPSAYHRLDFMKEVSRRAVSQSVIGGEFPSSYLGVLGALSLVSLGLYAMWLIARKRGGVALGWAGTAVWLVLAHSVGGLNSFMGLFNMRLFRSVNRVSVEVLAVALLFGAWFLGRLLARRRRALRWALVGVVGVAGAWEQLPTTDPNESIAGNRRIAESDRRLVSQMENALPKGAMVFELPTMHFPEVPPHMGVDGYEMFRPTFYSDTLRFSHGDVKGRPNAEWKFRVSGLPVPQMVAELRTAGFAGLYVNRKGFADGGRALLGDLQANGCRVIGVAEIQDTVALAL